MVLAAALENLRSFSRDFLSDLKSSRRFQVAFVLWIPLFVAGLIGFIRFSIRNEMHEKYHEWDTTFIPQSSIQYPDIRVSYANRNIILSQTTCQTILPPSLPVQVSICMWDPNSPEGRANIPCLQLKTSSVNAINKPTSWGGSMFGNPINCTFQFSNSSGNQEVYIHTPGGWGGQAWSFPPTFVRPCKQTGVHLENQLFFPMSSSPISIWNTQVLYEDSEFYDGSMPYGINILFRIPFGAQQVSWEAVGFDSWFLIAAWGGLFYFMWFLHLTVFSGLKFILPNDSKLLRQRVDAEYTPLK